MKCKVIIVDGIVDSVLVDDEAKQAKLEVEIVDFDGDEGDDDLLREEYDLDNNIPFTTEHCIPDSEE